jgi:hypothetical protein
VFLATVYLPVSAATVDLSAFREWHYRGILGCGRGGG